MEYDFKKIRADLEELKVQQEVMANIDNLVDMANRGEDVASGLRSLVFGLTDEVSDAENSPLNTSQQYRLQTDVKVLKYLRRLSVMDN
ncbi:MAG: hypothetical protein AABX29_07410 [Nanoarchaeota archaeon]